MARRSEERHLPAAQAMTPPLEPRERLAAICKEGETLFMTRVVEWGGNDDPNMPSLLGAIVERLLAHGVTLAPEGERLKPPHGDWDPMPASPCPARQALEALAAPLTDEEAARALHAWRYGQSVEDPYGTHKAVEGVLRARIAAALDAPGCAPLLPADDRASWWEVDEAALKANPRLLKAVQAFWDANDHTDSQDYRIAIAAAIDTYLSLIHI